MRNALYADRLVNGKRTTRLVTRYDEAITPIDLSNLAQALGVSASDAECALANMGVAIRTG